ncbi:CDP-alcohol phosphatidyltransferase family protein [Cryptosporangium aurantiacum]|uniref:CDP-diacylglycerol---serine O-phosphatidyltransferase n=1 Tax=Cryptosporangium aurantiacum TaxID=134849 RepID=A0A1M7QUY6_9ACTN|nr:CDP-alcohol phosphatidyltransferase family protein [Cryptosporangium aurantiacum]SHN35744.1 CDP-diacylglycerol---serine O-phosphatidyltransferase [Cryptosporangium aurantiacum]
MLVRRRGGLDAGAPPGVDEVQPVGPYTTLTWPDGETRRAGDPVHGTPVRRRARESRPATPAERLASEAPQSAPLLTGEHTIARRCQFALVQSCTLASLVLGLAAIYTVLQGEVRIGAAVLLACVLFDGADGALARAFGVSTPFGAQMDSLADMCSFGIATPVVVFAWLVGPSSTVVAGVACAMIAICAAIRLARFNVSPKNGRFFSGVPTTIAAAIMVIAVLLRPEAGRWAAPLFVAALAVAMVSSFPYLKIGALRRVPRWLLPLAAVAVVLDPTTTLGLLVGAYLLSGPLLWARQKRGITAV